MKTLSHWLSLVALGFLAGLPPAATAEDAPVRGIDVSHHSGAVDWPTVKEQGFAFAYVKATEGVDALDPTFAWHWRETAASGLPRGAYHFYVTEDDPNAQADFFLSTVPADDLGELVPVIDVELIGHGTRDDWPSSLRIFLGRVTEHFGVKPMIYTGPTFWDRHVGDVDFGDHPLWIAEYDVDEPQLPEGWNRWMLWQNRGDQSVPGVESGADVSVLHPDSSLEALRREPPKE